MTKATMTMLMGLPCSGKSTFIRDGLIGHRHPNDFHVISSDQMIEDVASTLHTTYSAVFKDVINHANKAFFKCVDEAVEGGFDFIVDRTFLTPKSRKAVFDLVDSTKYEIAVYQFAVLDEEVFKARNEFRANDEGKEIPLEVFRSMRDSYTAIQPHEPVDHLYTINTNRDSFAFV